MPLAKTTYTPENLEVLVRLKKQVTVVSGQTVSKGETVHETVNRSAATGVADGSNTGNATISAITVADDAQTGTWSIIMLTATTFEVIAPDGNKLAAEGATGTAYADILGLTVTVGGTPMIAGDFFTTLVTVIEGKVTSFLTGNDPSTIMAEDVDASGGDVVGLAYREADLLASEVDFGTGSDAEVRDALADKNIFLRD
jgi:hypothetical protein